jgi:excisionase family DNA binding protein
MPSTDDRLRERAGLLTELWPDSGDAAPEAADPLSGRLLRTREVALLFQVSERAVTDWARRGRLPSVRTPGGHRRYPARAVRDLLEGVGLRPR